MLVGGLSRGLRLTASQMIKGSVGMTGVMKGARDTAIALSHELGRIQGGMAGDDDAGEAFAKVYKSASTTTLDQVGFSAYLLGHCGSGLMRTAREFMSNESDVVAQITGQQVDLTAGMADPSDGCEEAFLNLGQELPEEGRHLSTDQVLSPRR
ncbi:hypothetical protein [Streptomyces sp. NRRL F-5053]|uniref:hypothetical protein n=1 Tax=Streptomyces sp. NRRL F-5053 TaxID=1463854 RepID=UPI001F36BB97|nr:hypothetical protein [Streptomyces sp. NRRL F-5053]